MPKFKTKKVPFRRKYVLFLSEWNQYCAIFSAVYRIIEAIIGMEISASSVVRKVPCAMTVSSLPYFRQKIVPNEATGMAISKVFMAIEVSLKCTPGIMLMSWKAAKTVSGSIISRKKAIRKTFGPPAICRAGICEIE